MNIRAKITKELVKGHRYVHILVSSNDGDLKIGVPVDIYCGEVDGVYDMDITFMCTTTINDKSEFTRQSIKCQLMSVAN